MRPAVCDKRPSPGPIYKGHCDHNGKCCWCGESKDPEHGPFKDDGWDKWVGGNGTHPYWEQPPNVLPWRPYPYDTGGNPTYPPGTILCNQAHGRLLADGR